VSKPLGQQLFDVKKALQEIEGALAATLLETVKRVEHGVGDG